jgi:hypothetical protein
MGQKAPTLTEKQNPDAFPRDDEMLVGLVCGMLNRK